MDYVLFMRGEPVCKLNPEEVAEVQYVDQNALRELVAKVLIFLPNPMQVSDAWLLVDIGLDVDKLCLMRAIDRVDW